MVSLNININGRDVELDINPKMPLLWALRDFVGLTGTKYGCGRALCGACTVHIEGQAVRSCSITVDRVAGKKITTIEAVSGRVADAVKAAWQELNVVQCGYCQSGQIMSAISLLTGNTTPSDEDIDLGMEGNICRCGTYQRIRDAIHKAARALG
jgi:isoquinoline 1-oxidoreductase alpha subunit